MAIPDSKINDPGIDASTAIIMYKGGLLGKLAESFHLYTTTVVTKELKAGNDGKEIIAVLSTGTTVENSCKGIFGKGENSILQLFQSSIIDTVFTDDGDFLKYCRKNSIPHFSSIMLPYLLFVRRALTREQAYGKFEEIKQIGRFSPWVLEYAEGVWV